MAYVKRSNVAVYTLNLSREERKDPIFMMRVAHMRRKAQAQLALAILLLKLNSKSAKAIEWASQLTRDMGDVA